MLLALLVHLFLFTQHIYADEGVNFAFGKPTWQSSTEAEGVSSRAVDGYKHPDYSQNSCMQTKKQYEAWWMVDLEQKVFVTTVKITNRADCCWENLVNFDIRVGTNLTNGGKFNPQCGPTYIYNVGAGETLTIKCEPPLLGQYLSISIQGTTGTLSFCEVEVYGYQRENVFSVKAISYGAKDLKRLRTTSLLTIDDTYNIKLHNRGHYVISFDMTTGQKISHAHFDTHSDSSVKTKMPLYLQNLPFEIFVFVIMHNAGINYYHTSIPILQSLSGYSYISDQLSWGDAWSLLGYKGKLPSPSWRASVMKNLGHTPAVIEDVVPKLSVPPRPPSSVIIVDLTSSSFTLRWSRPSGIVNENELPLNYTVCVRKSGTVDNDCKNNGNINLFTIMGLNPQTEYGVSVKAQSYAGFGPEAVVYVTTMEQDKYKIYVELVSRVKPDVLYRIGAEPHSSITIRGRHFSFVQAGHHFIVLNPETGSEIEQASFDTDQNPYSSTKMVEFLSTIPRPSIILMVVYYKAHNYYTGSYLRSLCPNAPLNYTTIESWSMICFNGFGSLPWVSSLMSTGNKGPAVIKEDILLPKELKKAPVLYDIIPVSSRSLELHWTAPETDQYTGEIVYHEICYQKSNIDINANCSFETVGGTLTRAVVSGLHPFQGYKIKIRGVVALGYGPYSNVFISTTPEAVPSSGPSNIEFLTVSTSSIFVTWSLPQEQDRNGIIQQYSVCAAKNRDSLCDNTTVTTNTWFEISGLKPYQQIKFEIKAATAVGFGPATIVYQRTLPSVPAGPPNKAQGMHIKTTNISLSWLPPDPELCNGRIINYTICILAFSTSPGPCLQEIFLGNQTDFTVTNLKPYTQYIIKISAGTKVGFGPPALVVNTTLQAAPSGPPSDLQVTDFNHNHMEVRWSPPDPVEVNGVLTEYSVCIRTQSSSTCLHGFTVPFTQTSYSFSNLRPYFNYSIEVKAATMVGFGPKANIFQKTSQSEPSGPPTRKTVTFVNESTISFSWSAPEPGLQNGVIMHYSVCIREMQSGPESSCTRTAKISANDDNNSFIYSGLSPSKEYIVMVKAATVVGLGPPAFILKTSGECDLPVLHLGGHVSDDRFSASGFLGKNYEPYQARIDNDLPWCDRGSRNNAYIQVDFGGPLKVLGVSTKGHKQHWQSWVSSYKVSYSLNDIEWKYVNVGGKMVVNGNNGEGGEVQHFLDEPILTRFVRFEVYSFVGLHPCMGVEVYGCAPAIMPNKASIQLATSNSIQITWDPLPSETDNGKLFGYKICHKPSSSLVPCETAGYVGHDSTSYSVENLTPYTDYNIEISAGTIAGYGPPLLLHGKTKQSRPSGPPHLVMAQDVTATSLKLVWSPPEENHRNGVIRIYGLCFQEASLETSCKKIVSIPGEQTSYDITEGLRPNTEYMFIVFAATASPGWGPRAVLYVTTLPAAPSGPPTSVYANRIGPKILQIFWQPPVAKKQNGDIIGYRLCIKEKSFNSPCRKYVTLPETQTMHTVDNLKPYTVYDIHVEAKTAIGYGPAQYLDYRTGEAAPSAPPKDVAIRSVSSDSIEIVWAAPDKEMRNGVIVTYELIVYQEMSNSKVKKMTSSLMNANTTLWKVYNLSPLTDYIFQIKAGTTEGFGPAVIIHKRSDGRIGVADEFSEGKLTAGGIAGGSIMMVVLIAGLIVSILWNKGLLPHTKTRKLKLELVEKQRRRRRRKHRRRRRKKKNSEPAATAVNVHATNSVYSELNDYDVPNASNEKAQKDITAEELYDTVAGDIPTGTTLTRNEIFAPVTNVAVSQDIYGTSVALSGQNTCIYGTISPGRDIYDTVKQSGNASAHATGSDINSIRKSKTILPSIVPRPSMLPPVIPLETTLSSVFINMSSTKLNDPDSSSIINHSPIPSNPTSPMLHMGTGNQSNRSTTQTFMIPQPSNVIPNIANLNTAPVIKVDNAFSESVREDFTNTVREDFACGTDSFGASNHYNHSDIPRNFHDLQTSRVPSQRIPEPVPHQPSIPIPSKKRKSTVPTVDS